MEEILQDGEQPTTQSITQDEDTLNNEVENSTQNVEKVVDNVELNGSLGKFKDAQSLLTAYNNLQAEFTKKCQALSEMKVKTDEKAVENVKDTTLIYQRENWTELVSAFLEKNKEAQPFAKDIASLLMQDKELASSDSALDVAYAKVISKSFVAPKQVVEDENFVNDYVLKSEKIKNAVLNLYLKELKNNQAPSVLTEKSGASQVLYKVPTANSLSEAKTIVKQMFD